MLKWKKAISLYYCCSGWLYTEYTAMEVFSFLLAFMHSDKIENHFLAIEHFEASIEYVRGEYPKYYEHLYSQI
jgi:hypothetical protein